MAEYLSPGVYVEEFDSGIKPMEGVSTSTAGFIGMTERGPVRGVPEFVGSYGEYQRKFGGYLPKQVYGSRRFLPMAVEQFFANGGTRCFVVRLLPEDGSACAGAQAGQIRFTASSPGAWGNKLIVRCKRSPVREGLYNLVVAAGTRADDYMESYQDVNLDPASENYMVRVLEKSLLIRADASEVVGTPDLVAMISGESPANTEHSGASSLERIKAAGQQEEARAKADALQTVVVSAERKENQAKADMMAKWSAMVSQEKQLELVNAGEDKDDALINELQQNLSQAKASYEDARTMWESLKSYYEEKRIQYKKAEAEWAAAAQVKTSYEQKPEPGAASNAWTTLPFSGGVDCPEDEKPCNLVNAAVLAGHDGGPGRRTGLSAFLDIPEISILVAPGVTDEAEAKAVITHCELTANRVCILDMEEGVNKVTDLQAIRRRYSTSYASLYHPWIEVFDPLEKRNAYIPPSGTMAGIYARSDNTRGVHKAPANEVLRNCTGLQTLFGKAEQDMLNPIGVNLLRNIQGLGIRVWGARTCSDDSSWKYINVRRLFIYIEESIRRNTGWAVFEPNDQLLWTKVRGSITSFLGSLWRSGALSGASESESYFVNVGKGSTMTDDDILNGRLICVIGVAPVRPAEFIVFRITQIMEQNG